MAMVFGQVRGSNPAGQPRKIWIDIVLSDFHKLNFRRPFEDKKNKRAWRDKTWATHTWHMCWYLLLLVTSSFVSHA